jgi:PAS domain S-box-containing protein
MNVRPVSDKWRIGWALVRKLILAVLRWTFIVIGAVTASAVMFTHLFNVNAEVYDPAMFAIGVAGLFSMGCGIMLMLLSRNSRLRLEVRRASARCEELADHVWELKEAEARATSLLEAQGDVIVRRDAEGAITYVNDAYCTLAGVPRAKLLGSTTATLHVLQQGEISVAHDGTRVHDQEITTPEGPRWFAWRDVVVWANDDDCAEVQSVGRDVTDRTQSGRALAEARDAAEAANRAKSQFLAMVSHEIRTPMNGILGMTDLLMDTQLTPEQATYAKAARTSGEALLSLIDEVLDFSKIEAGKLDLEAKPVALATLVEEIVELLGPRAQAKGLEIGSDVHDKVPEQIIGDATRLRQVLLNLAGNAIKFTETGGVSVIVEPGADGGIVFDVRDTGIGIAPEEQARIFHEFEQAEGGLNRKFGGTGLGLAISKRIVERMGGSIAIESAPGAGSTFRVTVPLQSSGNAQSFTPPDLAGKSVLIVAPQSIEASLTARRLTRWGASVAIANKESAAAMLTEGRFDVMIVDHVTNAAAAYDTLLPNAPAQRIVLVAPGERHRLPALKDAGFTGYLVKPVRAASLKARIASTASFESVPPATEAPRTSVKPNGRTDLSILVAEDNEINALLVRSLLTKLGHRPAMVTDGAAALEAWRTANRDGAPFDLVLMDMHMPGVDGLEAARRIRATETTDSVPRTPIIALTANAFAEDREACLAAGMDGYLVKPLDRHNLAATLADLPKKAARAAA